MSSLVKEGEELSSPEGRQQTSDDLRAQLYVSLRRKGILDSLKTQLRKSLITELHSNGQGNTSLTSSLHKRNKMASSSSLNHQIAHYLITNHLQYQGCEYSLSTYLPEAGVQLDKLLSFKDVCQVLGLNETQMTTKDCKEKEESSFLLQLLQIFPTVLKQTPPELISRESQTETEEGQLIEQQEEEERESIERRMLAFQKDCEARHRETLEQEMTRFRDKELSLVRLEERNKYLKELTRNKEQIDQKYSEKLSAANALLEDERIRLRRRESELERDLFSQRQALLNEMESLKVRENELKRQSELDKRAAGLERDKASSLQLLLSEKEDVLSSLKEQYEQMVEAKVERNRIELQTKTLQEGRQKIELNNKLEVQQQLMKDLQERFNGISKELDRERSSVKELHSQLHSSTEKQSEYIAENLHLQEKLKQSKSENQNTFWKERASELERELEELKGRQEEEKIELNTKLTEQMNVVQEIKNKLTKSSKQHQTFQEQLKESKSHTSSLQQESKLLREDIAKKTDIILQLHKRLTEMTVELHTSHSQVQELQDHIESLHNVLTSTKQDSKPKKRFSPRRKVKVPSSSTPPTDLSPLPLPSPMSSTLEGGRGREGDVSFSDSSAQILAEARATFARLEKESEEMTKLYNCYGAPSLSHPLSSTLMATSLPPVAMTTLTDLNYLESLFVTTAPPMTSLTTPPRPITPPIFTSSNITCTSSAIPIMTSFSMPSLTTPPNLTSMAMPTFTHVTTPPRLTSMTTPTVTHVTTPPRLTSMTTPTFTHVTMPPIITSLPMTSQATPTITTVAMPPIMSLTTHPSPLPIAMATTSVPSVDLSSYWNKSSVAMTTPVTIATSTGDKWREERKRKEELRRQEEIKQKEQIQQEVLQLQQREEENTAQQSSSHHESSSESEDNKGEVTMKDYLQSVQQYNSTIKQQSPTSHQKQDDIEQQQLEVLSVPAESVTSGQESDPFENW